MIDLLIDLMPRRLRLRVVERERMLEWVTSLAREWKGKR